MYLYETHCHTSPVSRCATATVEETVDFYKNAGYDGIFITNHYLDSNIGIDFNEPYEKKLDFYFSAYYTALEYGKKIGLKVFPGVEISTGGTDFLIYNLPESWYYEHPETMNLKKSQLLQLMLNDGALVVQAHPFREASYIDHIRLFPRCIQAVEIINANRKPFENEMAKIYAEAYGLKPFAGSDNHSANRQKIFAGLMSESPLTDVADFKQRVLNGEMQHALSNEDKMKVFNMKILMMVLLNLKMVIIRIARQII